MGKPRWLPAQLPHLIWRPGRVPGGDHARITSYYYPRIEPGAWSSQDGTGSWWVRSPDSEQQATPAAPTSAARNRAASPWGTAGRRGPPARGQSPRVQPQPAQRLGGQELRGGEASTGGRQLGARPGPLSGLSWASRKVRQGPTEELSFNGERSSAVKRVAAPSSAAL